MVRSQTDRLAEKTVERQFLHELENDFELAPATSRALLSAAQQVLLSSSRNSEVREGQMLITVVSAREPAGKPLTAMQKVSVVVTVDGGLEDLAVLQQHGTTSLRRIRVLRIPEEAMDQGGVLTQEDLARLLQTGVRTIRRDVAQLRADGHWVPTRGTVQDTGRGQSHKAKIVEMYLRRMTFTEIALCLPNTHPANESGDPESSAMSVATPSGAFDVTGSGIPEADWLTSKSPGPRRNSAPR